MSQSDGIVLVPNKKASNFNLAGFRISKELAK
jgi:hypothetical protein